MRSPLRTRRSSVRHMRRPRSALILLLFTVMLLAPIGSQVATAHQADVAQRLAQGDGEDGDEGTQEEQGEGEFAPEATEEPTLEPTEEPPAQPTEEPQNELLGAIEISYWECPGTVDASNPDLENLGLDCAGRDGLQFSVSDSMGGNHAQQTGEFGDSHVSFTELPTGQTMISGPGGPGMAWCNGIVQHGGPETGYQSFSLNGGSFGWNLQDDEIVFCDWILVAEMTDDVGAVEIEYRQCETGYTFLDGTNEDNLDQMLLDCEQVNDVEFTIDQGGPDGTTQVTGFYGESHVSFLEVPTGMRTIAQTQPFTNTYVLCEGIVSNGGAETGPMVMSVLNGAIQWNLIDEEIAYCSWFVAAEEVADATETPTGDDVGAVEIEYRECPAGYQFLDGTNEDNLDQMLLDCAQANDVEFTIDQAGPDGTTQVTGFYGDSHVSFLEVPIGMRTITQTMPFPDTYVVCEGIVSNGGPETGAMAMPVSSGSVQWNLIDEEIAYCSWFVTGEASETPGSPMADPLNELVGHVNINYWECPTTTNFGTVTDEGLATECTGTTNGVVFSVASGAYSATQATGDINDGVIAFDEVPTGQISVKQVTPPQQLIVICQGIVSNGGPETAIMRLPITQATVQWNLLDDEIVYCDWYVIPLAAGFGSVAINKHACPVTFDASSADIYELAANCHEAPGTVDFTVTSGAYTVTDQATGNADYASFEDVPSGPVTVTETVPDGYAEPIVFCKIEAYPSLDDLVPTHRVELLGGDSFTRVLGADQVLWCDVYNVIDAGPAAVAINKHACPVGFDAYNADIYELAANCHDDPGTVPFTVTSGDYTETKSASGGGTYASFPEVPAGTLTITETIPDGYGSPIVYCKVELALDLTDVEPTTLYPMDESGSFTKQVQGGHLLWCDVFNVPEDGSTITITKYDCPEGTGYEEGAAWYQSNCTETLADITFRLDHSEGSLTKETNANGMVTFDDVPLGPFGVQEFIPAEYGDPVVVCGFTAYANGAIIDGFPQRVETPGGYYSGELTFPNTDYFCFWFNIYGGPGEITVYKWTCPEGYDPHAWGVDPYEDCTEGPNGITFTNDGPDGYTSQTDTGDSVEYAVYWGGLEPGEYTVTEQVPDGIAAVFVWDCYGQREGELRPTPLTTEPTVTLDLHAGEAIICHWFNVPEDPDGTLTVIKYECSTRTWVSEVDCEIYEGGQTFDLAQWNGAAWDVIATNTTDGFGRYTWYDLEPGEYWVAEQGRDWCHMTSTGLSADGNWLNVEANAETVVKVYNCTGEPGKPGKTPTKYPNTGVPASFREAWRLAA